MDFFHLNAKIISKSKGVSAVASSAYCTASKMKNERTGLTHDFSRKSDVIFSDTVLPVNAPPEFKNREVLWNSVEQIEKNSNSQLARRFDLAIPNEYSREDATELFGQIGRYFADQGMCFDGGIHWEEGNHHFDFLVTMRPFKENGAWGSKEKKEYALDRDGNRIPVIDSKTGQQKLDSRNRKQWKRITVDSTGWNTREKLEEWRSTCCEIINQKNRNLGLNDDIDYRSYERQGKDQIPMQHEGYVAREMEERGLVSERCSDNREIRKINGLADELLVMVKKVFIKMIAEARDVLERKRDNTARFKNEKSYGRDDIIDRGAGEGNRGNEGKDGKTNSEEISIGSISAQLDDIRARLELIKRKRRERLQVRYFSPRTESRGYFPFSKRDVPHMSNRKQEQKNITVEEPVKKKEAQEPVYVPVEFHHLPNKKTREYNQAERIYKYSHVYRTHEIERANRKEAYEIDEWTRGRLR